MAEAIIEHPPSSGSSEHTHNRRTILAQLDTSGLIDDDDTGPYCDRMAALYDLICDTPARTYAGVREQIAFVNDSIRHNCPSEREQTALANALATLERLGGGAIA